MSAKYNVLIFPAGSEIGLEINNSLKYSHHLEVFGISGKSDHAAFVYEDGKYFEDNLLYIDHPDFIDLFNGYLKKLKIDFVYPTHDAIANFLAKYQNVLYAEIITSCAQTNYVARYKREKYKKFSDCDFSLNIYAQPFDNLKYPVFLKPNDGQGGQNTFIAEDQRDLDFFLRKKPDLLVTGFLPGNEMSVDCFTDFNRKLLFIGPRTRERVQMGISFRSTAVAVNNEIASIANTINERVVLNGAWFFQVKQDVDGKYKLLEFAPRQSSTMGLYRHAGINFALLSFFNARKIPVKIIKNNYELQVDRCLFNRYKAVFNYSKLYIDLDDTIIFGDRVHDKVMAYIYQSRNRGVRVILITKHRFDLDKTLDKHGIAKSIFSEIIHLSEDEDKWKFIEPEGAIFIDNYWFDRHEVKEKLSIPVFDVDAVECLMR